MGEAILAGSMVTLRRGSDRGGAIPYAFWIGSVATVAAAAAGVDLASPGVSACAAVLLLIGGLPHGAFDLALARAAGRVGAREGGLLLAAYLAVAGAMAFLWSVAPTAALSGFLVMAAIHFGEDWEALREPFLRMAAGASVIAAPLLGRTAEVTAIFETLAAPHEGATVAMVALAIAPVVMLVGGVGLVAAWRDGAKEWATASAAALLLLASLPPMIGFALFFVLLHSPKHLMSARADLAMWTSTRFLVTGAALSACAAIGWWLVRPDEPLVATVDAFRLLATVAAPHLLLSTWIERKLRTPRFSGQGMSSEASP